MAVDHCESSPQTPAPDRRHGYLRKLAHDGNDLRDTALAAIAAPVALVSHVVKIAARRVGIAGTPGDDAANVVIITNSSEKVSQLIEKGYAQGIFLFGPIERQPGDAFLLVNVVDDEFVVGHEYLLTKNSFKVVQNVQIVQAVIYNRRQSVAKSWRFKSFAMTERKSYRGSRATLSRSDQENR